MQTGLSVLHVGKRVLAVCCLWGLLKMKTELRGTVSKQPYGIKVLSAQKISRVGLVNLRKDAATSTCPSAATERLGP